MVSLADSEAIKGENEAKAQVAESNATLTEKQAEAMRRATAAEKIQAAKALQEAYAAEQEAEQARSDVSKRQLMGFSDGQVNNSFADNTVSGSDTVGGLIGRNNICLLYTSRCV